MTLQKVQEADWRGDTELIFTHEEGADSGLPGIPRLWRVSGTKSGRWRWHPKEIFVAINGKRHYLGQAVDDAREAA